MPWYLSGGIALANVVAAYQAKSAASLAASYVNLANPGTNNAAPGVAPTFNAATGWTFNGTSQYLIAPTPDNGYSIFMQYANLAVAGTRELFGTFWTSFGDGAFLVQIAGGNMDARSGATGSTAINAPELLTGNYGFAGKTPYRNGTAEPNVISAGTGTGHEIFIAALNFNGGLANFTAIEVQAFAMYNVTLTAPQVSALAAAMAAL